MVYPTSDAWLLFDTISTCTNAEQDATPSIDVRVHRMNIIQCTITTWTNIIHWQYDKSCVLSDSCRSKGNGRFDGDTLSTNENDCSLLLSMMTRQVRCQTNWIIHTFYCSNVCIMSIHVWHASFVVMTLNRCDEQQCVPFTCQQLDSIEKRVIWRTWSTYDETYASKIFESIDIE
jgi:hypothetical protein